MSVGWSRLEASLRGRHALEIADLTPQERPAAVRLLLDHLESAGDPRAAEALPSLWEPSERAEALTLLGRLPRSSGRVQLAVVLGDEALVREGLDDRRPLVRQRALRALRHDRGCLLRAMVEDVDEDTRLIALDLLCRRAGIAEALRRFPSRLMKSGARLLSPLPVVRQQVADELVAILEAGDRGEPLVGLEPPPASAELVAFRTRFSEGVVDEVLLRLTGDERSWAEDWLLARLHEGDAEVAAGLRSLDSIRGREALASLSR